jgi:hypothetical protein
VSKCISAAHQSRSSVNNAIKKENKCEHEVVV